MPDGFDGQQERLERKFEAPVRRIVLASGSPRRRELLSRLERDFIVDVPEVDETLAPGEWLTEATTRLASLKGVRIAARHPGCVVIAADTLVGIEMGEEQQILGKPRSQDEAIAMLRLLSGKSHCVATGVWIAFPNGKQLEFCERSTVQFRELSIKEIESYVETGEPLDKAGAYAIQGLAAAFVQSIEGSLTNVVGLPIERLEAELNAMPI